MKNESEKRVRSARTTISKLKDIASLINPNYDFIDFWYNFNLWDEKASMDTDSLFWRNAVGANVTLQDFYEVYTPIENKHINASQERILWFVQYTQYWIFYRNISGKSFVEKYGKEVLDEMINSYGYYHCFGENVFMEEMEEKYGKVYNAVS